jgi:hypothetical protein
LARKLPDFIDPALRWRPVMNGGFWRGQRATGDR